MCTTTENQGAGVKYMGSGVYVDVSVSVIRLNMAITPWWMEKVMVYYVQRLYCILCFSKKKKSLTIKTEKIR